MKTSISFALSAISGTVVLLYSCKRTKLVAHEKVPTTDEEIRLQPQSTKTDENPSVPSVCDRCRIQCTLKHAIIKARELTRKVQNEVGAPGLVVGVSIDGQPVWEEGFGFADIENQVPCHPNTVMRIASISKSITMAVVAKLWEEGKLDLDKPVQEYVPSFPKKTYKGKEVTLTTRMLVSHLGGIRHYVKQSNEKEENSKDKNTAEKKRSVESELEEDRIPEFFIKEKYDSVEKALQLFQNDELMSEPGTTFLYSTHGWTLVSAVVEGVTKTKFPKLMKKFFQVMGMKNTYLDENEPIIYNRSRYYTKNKRGRNVNAPYVDNSYKWAGGGFLSTVGDLMKFGNAMLYSYQYAGKHKYITRINEGDYVEKTVQVPGSRQNNSISSQVAEAKESSVLVPGYLKPETMKELWTKAPKTEKSYEIDDGYGMGWSVVPYRMPYGGGLEQPFYVGHTGGAMGASSVLLILPPKRSQGVENPPKGIVVAMICNIHDVGLNATAFKIAEAFADATHGCGVQV